MVQDNPNQMELEEMVKFSKSYNTYIYGHSDVEKMISKYLFYSEIKIDGFIMAEVQQCEKVNEPFPILNLVEAKKIRKKHKVGVIIACEDSQYNQVVALLKLIGISHFYFVSEWNKRTIPKKMLPRRIEDFYLEVNLADHCNLNCQCCDHFSPIATPTFLNYNQYVKDIERIACLTDGKIGLMKLQGGEPLMNSQVLDYIKITRKTFPDSPICLFTDGLLLPKWGKSENNIWEVIRECEVEVRMTQYPISLNLQTIIEDASKYDVPVTFDPPTVGKGARLWIFSEIGALDYKGVKHSVKHPFDLNGCVDKFRWISCYQFNESIVLRDGKIYTCPMIPYSHYFNDYFKQNLKVTDDCYIDIYEATTFEEISEFCTRRTSFCNYCAVNKRYSRPWKQSTHELEEWTL